MIIKNVRAYCGKGFEQRDITIKSGRITSDAPLPDDDCIDGSGLLALPGLVDIHLHGAAGRDFCEGSAQAIQAIADFEAKEGVLAFCGATMSYDEQTLANVMKAAAGHKNGLGSDLVGINMEGPFISPKKAGAQNKAFLRDADLQMFNRLNELSGKMIKLVDMAPEVKGAMEFAGALGGRIKISLAHTEADYDTAKAFFAAGANHVTHLYNTMAGIGHRAPGPVIAALEAGAEVELIADGEHIHPAMVRLTFNTFGADKVILISDSMMACGLPNGRYTLGGQTVDMENGRCTLADSPDTLAGSATSLFGCMRCAVLDMGVPLAAAVRAASENPAASIGISEDYGSLMPGRLGNVILVNEKLEIARIIQKGRVIA